MYLVQDEEGGLFAIKEMDKRRIAKEPYLEEYLRGEIEIMKSLDSPYPLHLYKSNETDKHLYLLCEYCDGGDLEKDQAKQPGKVFNLNDATEILS